MNFIIEKVFRTIFAGILPTLICRCFKLLELYLSTFLKYQVNVIKILQ